MVKHKKRPRAYATNRKSIRARAQQAGMSSRSLYMEIEAGRGPKVTYLSPHRRSIEDDDWADWLRLRRDSPPPEVTRFRGPNKKQAVSETAAP
jgi:hypothetical protein